MTRAFVALLITLALAGCTDGNAPPQLVSGDMAPDQSVRVEDMPPSGSCTTACDCAPGQACKKGSCQTLSTPVFCCSSTTCSGSSICENSNGTVNQCDHRDAGAITPVTDGGTSPTQCQMQSCTRGAGGDPFCRLACGGMATCVSSGGNQHCSP